MKNNIVIFLIIIITTFYYIFDNEINEEYISILDEKLSEFSFGFQNNSNIPNIIWTFWEGEFIDTIQKCIDSWKFYNPDYKINILNKTNYSQYINDDIDSIIHASDSMARYSDYIRLAVLSKYGGFWLDASIICHYSFSWVHGVQNRLNVDMIGYYLNQSTYPEYKEISPVIESWFFACIPNSKFVCDWKDEFFSTRYFKLIDDYLDNVREEQISFQNIYDPEYLTIHISAQKILQKNIDKYDLCLFSACSGPFVSSCSTNWHFEISIENLTNNNTCKEYWRYPFLKLIRHDRNYFDNNINKDNAFSHLSKNIKI
jgi:hypothetical protein